MPVRKLTFFVAAIIGSGLAAQADPPHRSHELPPGLAKQGKVPPGHAKKLWGKGEYLPAEYRTVYLEDWERYDLRPAPRGYRWVLVEDDVYLTDVATGLITDVIIDLLVN